jgi:hypothetical protein
MTVTKRWLVKDLLDFDTFLNLRQSGIDITIANDEPTVITHSGMSYQYSGGQRWVQAVTTTSEQETLLLLCCNKLNFIGETTW